MKRLQDIWGDQIRIVDVLVRQGHPGPTVRPYTHIDQKLRDGERYRRDEHLPWTVVVDDLPGTVHGLYGLLADPAYLIGTDGRVSFYNYWTHVPTLHVAIGRLIAMGGSGVVGSHRGVHPLATLTGGWRAIRRGLGQSFIDLETAMPGSASSLWLGHKVQPLLKDLAFTARPWSPRTRSAVALGSASLVLTAGWLAIRLAANWRGPRRLPDGIRSSRPRGAGWRGRA